MFPTLSKEQFADLIKNKIMWADWNFQLADTVDGLINATNKEMEGVVEIVIDALYQKYVEIERWIEIIDVNTTDGRSESVVLRAPGHKVKKGDIIRVYGSPNYAGEHVVMDVTSDTIILGVVFKSEQINDQTYYTIVSPDGYRESDYQYFVRGSEVTPYNSSIVPKYLPLIGQKIGYKYDPRLSVAQNRKFIQSAIEVYRIKGTVLSIQRMMRLLGYECQVYEPYKNIYRYGKSAYSGVDHITDWNYYHHGVFEIITEGIPLALYKDIIAGTVQPVGTRLSGLCKNTLSIVPIIAEHEIQANKFNSIYQELAVKFVMSGAIYDVSSTERSRSASRQVTGFYSDRGVEMIVQAYRRVFDSALFAFEDLVEETWSVKPAGAYSTSRGAYSSLDRKKVYLPCPYTENTPFDLQLPFELDLFSARLPGRSDHGSRSGRFRMSGTPGTGWNWSRFWIYHQGPIVELIEADKNLAKDDFDRTVGIEIYLGQPAMVGPGVRLDIDRLRSGHVNIHGFEMITAWQYRGPTDWDNKLYYMYDDGCRYIQLYNLSENFSGDTFERGIALAPLIVRHDEPNIHDVARRSRKRHAVGFSVDLSFEFDPGEGERAVSIAQDESKRIESHIDRNVSIHVRMPLGPHTYSSGTRSKDLEPDDWDAYVLDKYGVVNCVVGSEIEIVSTPMFAEPEPKSVHLGRYSREAGLYSGQRGVAVVEEQELVFDQDAKYSSESVSGRVTTFQIQATSADPDGVVRMFTEDRSARRVRSDVEIHSDRSSTLTMPSGRLRAFGSDVNNQLITFDPPVFDDGAYSEDIGTLSGLSTAPVVTIDELGLDEARILSGDIDENYVKRVGKESRKLSKTRRFSGTSAPRFEIEGESTAVTKSVMLDSGDDPAVKVAQDLDLHQRIAIDVTRYPLIVTTDFDLVIHRDTISDQAVVVMDELPRGSMGEFSREAGPLSGYEEETEFVKPEGAQMDETLVRSGEEIPIETGYLPGQTVKWATSDDRELSGPAENDSFDITIETRRGKNKKKKK
jgi:hypothetical protein